jgi:DNA-directed RNA polymerase subunit RPC12/RpoP
MIEKIKDKIQDLSNLQEKTKEKTVIPYNLRKELDDNIQVKVELQEKLGLFNREEQNKDAFDKINRLKKRFKKWLEENQASRKTPCPHCGQMIMLKMDLTHWETLKHPWFKDKFLWNQHGWDLYKAGKITALDLAKILLGKNTQSTDFITWLEEKQTKK